MLLVTHSEDSPPQQYDGLSYQIEREGWENTEEKLMISSELLECLLMLLNLDNLSRSSLLFVFHRGEQG